MPINTLKKRVRKVKSMKITKKRGNSAINIKNVNIPNGCTSIETKAFYRCANLNRLFIPSSVTYIGEYAFAYAGC